MMRILITESQLEKMLSKTDVDESLGVPDNLTNVAEKMYDELVERMKTKIVAPPTDYMSIFKTRNEDFFSITLLNNYDISDYKITEVRFAINIVSGMIETNTHISKMFAFPVFEKNTNDYSKIKHVKNDKITISIEISTSMDWKEEYIINFMKKNRIKNIALLSHELKHYYDHYKKEYTGFREMSKYQTYVKTLPLITIPPVKNFIFYLYYMTNIECLTRPSELKYIIDSELPNLIKNNKIDKDGFLNILMDNDIYKTLKMISEFNYENFRTELKLYKEDIVNYLLRNKIDIRGLNSDDAKINKYLEFVIKIILDKKTENALINLNLNLKI